MGVRRGISLLVAVLLSVTAAGSARADLSSADLAASDSHVREARRLLQRGRTAEACTEYEQAHRDYPRSAVLLELADCYKAAGYPGSADEALRNAQKLAVTENYAGARNAAVNRSRDLQRRLSRVRIVVAPPLKSSELEVTMDARPITLGGADSVHVVDPELLTVKTHVLVVTAPGFEPRRWELVLAAGEEKTIRVEDLKPLAASGDGAGLDDLRLDRAAGAPVGRLSNETRVSVALGATSGVYQTRASVPPPVLVGTGTFGALTLRLSVASGRWSAFARESLAYPIETPGDRAGPFALSAPEIGGGYRLPLGKFALNMSPSVTPPVLPTSADPRLRFARQIGALANPGGFGARQLAFSLAAILEVPRFGPMGGIFGVIPQVNHSTMKDGFTLVILVQIVRIVANATKQLSFFVGDNYTLVTGLPIGALHILQGTAGGGYRLEDGTQLSLAVTRTLFSPPPAFTAWVIDLGATFSF